MMQECYRCKDYCTSFSSSFLIMQGNHFASMVILLTPSEFTSKHHTSMLTFQLTNSSMSKVRAAVEWMFGDIASYFAFLDFKKNLKIGLSPVGTMYNACALIRNAHTCLYSSTSSSFFDLEPPTIQEYFQI